jgi:cytochrome c oxidase cbb3-type subunit I/II
VAFFLTTPILGIMYYFMPKAAERPVYSYRLSVVHFWSLVFLYIWAGPHHLLNTALPDWLQMLGMTFSLMLWAPPGAACSTACSPCAAPGTSSARIPS